MSDNNAMLAIQETLDGVEWNADSLNEIAHIIAHADANEGPIAAIRTIMNETEWTFESIDAIARIMIDAGYRIRDLHDCDDD